MEKIESILEAADELLDNAAWYSEDAYASNEMVVSTRCITALREAVEAFDMEAYNE
ncbi:hypothetical protein [Desulfobacter hydrogenophilus]|uniref:hypothetical protein n=1 Tax=Desulfobacter hydrogenophilus TaxID=2291 RepID=UPI0013D4B6CC|nr:hypothetical protein [Desulfobacter hydrogenophilus]NDY74469.1 hypothetical protein [Desulfobacter hydrogenophilus]